MVYNLQALNCVQEVAGYHGKRSAVAEPNTEADTFEQGLIPGTVGPDSRLIVCSHGLVGGKGLIPGRVGPDGPLIVCSHGLVGGHGRTPGVEGPDGRIVVGAGLVGGGSHGLLFGIVARPVVHDTYLCTIHKD